MCFFRIRKRKRNQVINFREIERKEYINLKVIENHFKQVNLNT